jgi:hypothetical protein
MYLNRKQVKFLLHTYSSVCSYNAKGKPTKYSDVVFYIYIKNRDIKVSVSENSLSVSSLSIGTYGNISTGYRGVLNDLDIDILHASGLETKFLKKGQGFEDDSSLSSRKVCKYLFKKIKESSYTRSEKQYKVVSELKDLS